MLLHMNMILEFHEIIFTLKKDLIINIFKFLVHVKAVNSLQNCEIKKLHLFTKKIVEKLN